jgi:hypothetical protein
MKEEITITTESKIDISAIRKTISEYDARIIDLDSRLATTPMEATINQQQAINEYNDRIIGEKIHCEFQKKEFENELAKYIKQWQ